MPVPLPYHFTAAAVGRFALSRRGMRVRQTRHLILNRDGITEMSRHMNP